MNARSVKAKALAAAVALAGATFQIASCDPWAQLGRGIYNLNPCLTILVCDPTVFEFARSGIDGPGAYLEEDPFCTFPPFCDGTVDPIFGGGNP